MAGRPATLSSTNGQIESGFFLYSNVCFAKCVYRFHVFRMEDPTVCFFRRCVYGEWVAVIYPFFMFPFSAGGACDVWRACGDTFAPSVAFTVFDHEYASACPPTSLWSDDVAMLILLNTCRFIHCFFFLSWLSVDPIQHTCAFYLRFYHLFGFKCQQNYSKSH